MTTAILFDLDGTLLDTLGDLTDATNHTLRHFGKPERTEAEMRHMWQCRSSAMTSSPASTP